MGLFGYEGSMCDMAIFMNNADQIEEAARRGWITPETETFDGMRLVKVARKRGSEAVARKLIELGWEDQKWPHPPLEAMVFGMDGHATLSHHKNKSGE
jgi:hypothetical protein